MPTCKLPPGARILSAHPPRGPSPGMLCFSSSPCLARVHAFCFSVSFVRPLRLLAPEGLHPYPRPFFPPPPPTAPVPTVRPEPALSVQAALTPELRTHVVPRMPLLARPAVTPASSSNVRQRPCLEARSPGSGVNRIFCGCTSSSSPNQHPPLQRVVLTHSAKLPFTFSKPVSRFPSQHGFLPDLSHYQAPMLLLAPNILEYPPAPFSQEFALYSPGGLLIILQSPRQMVLLWKAFLGP